MSIPVKKYLLDLHLFFHEIISYVGESMNGVDASFLSSVLDRASYG